MSLAQNANHTAVTDITVFYGADSYLRNTSPADPYGRKCFEILVDGIVNHPNLMHLHPNRESIENAKGQNVPKLLEVCYERQLVSGYEAAVADDNPFPLHVKSTFDSFAGFLDMEGQPETFEKWLSFHREIKLRKKHTIQCGGKDLILSFEQFWNDQRCLARIAGKLKRKGWLDGDIKYGFDVFARGFSYTWMSNERLKLPYLNHPLRDCPIGVLSSGWFDDDDMFTWGSYFANLIERGKISRNLTEIADLLEGTRRMLVQNDATIYSQRLQEPKEFAGHLMEVALDLGLPVTTAKWVGTAAAVMVLGSTAIMAASSLIDKKMAEVAMSGFVAAGGGGGVKIGLDQWYVPCWIARLPVIRRAMTLRRVRDLQLTENARAILNTIRSTMPKTESRPTTTPESTSSS